MSNFHDRPLDSTASPSPVVDKVQANLPIFRIPTEIFLIIWENSPKPRQAFYALMRTCRSLHDRVLGCLAVFRDAYITFLFDERGIEKPVDINASNLLVARHLTVDIRWDPVSDTRDHSDVWRIVCRFPLKRVDTLRLRINSSTWIHMTLARIATMNLHHLWLEKRDGYVPVDAHALQTVLKSQTYLTILRLGSEKLISKLEIPPSVVELSTDCIPGRSLVAHANLRRLHLWGRLHILLDSLRGSMLPSVTSLGLTAHGCVRFARDHASDLSATFPNVRALHFADEPVFENPIGLEELLLSILSEISSLTTLELIVDSSEATLLNQVNTGRLLAANSRLMIYSIVSRQMMLMHERGSNPRVLTVASDRFPLAYNLTSNIWNPSCDLSIS